MHRRFLPLALGTLLIAAPASLRADNPPAAAKSTETKLPAPADVKELSAHPKQIRLIGADDSSQLVLTAARAYEKHQPFKMPRS